MLECLRRANIMKKMEAQSLAHLLKTVMSCETGSEANGEDAPAVDVAPLKWRRRIEP